MPLIMRKNTCSIFSHFGGFYIVHICLIKIPVEEFVRTCESRIIVGEFEKIICQSYKWARYFSYRTYNNPAWNVCKKKVSVFVFTM